MEVTRATNVGVINDDGAFRRLRGTVEIVFEDGGNAFVGERTDRQRPGRDGLGACRIQTAEQAQHAEAGAEALLGMRPVGEYGDDQPLSVGSDRAGPTMEARPLGIAPMRAWHMLGMGAVTATSIAALMGRDALGAMEHLDGTAGDAHVDLGTDQRLRHRIKEAIKFHMIIGPDARQAPFSELVAVSGRGRSAGCSMLANKSRWLSPRRRMTWPLCARDMRDVSVWTI